MDDISLLKVSPDSYINMRRVITVETSMQFFRIIPEEDRTDGSEVQLISSAEGSDGSMPMIEVIFEGSNGDAVGARIFGTAAIETLRKIIRASQFANIGDEMFSDYMNFLREEDEQTSGN